MINKREQYDLTTVRNIKDDLLDFQTEESLRSYGGNHLANGYKEREYLKVDDIFDILRRREREALIAEQSKKG